MENKHYFVLFILSFIISLGFVLLNDCQNKAPSAWRRWSLKILEGSNITLYYAICLIFIYSFSSGKNPPDKLINIMGVVLGILVFLELLVIPVVWVTSMKDRTFYMVTLTIPLVLTIFLMIYMRLISRNQPLQLNNLVSGHLYIVFIPLFVTISAFINLILCSGPNVVTVTPSPAPATLVPGCNDIKDKTKCNESRSCLPDEKDKIKDECDESQKSKCYWVENSPTPSKPNPSLSPADKCIYEHDKCDIIDCNIYQPTNVFVDCCPVFDYEKFMDNVTKNEGGYDSDKKDELDYNLRRASQEEFHRRDEMDDDIYA